MDGTSPRKLDNYTYADYLGFPDDTRCEIIDGTVVMMSPGASSRHQSISTQIVISFGNQLKIRKCLLFHTPMDVLLDYTPQRNPRECRVVVQPDVLVVCDPRKVGENAILGAPDLVVEIVSPNSISHDANTKMDLYRKYSVPEYWMIFPKEQALVQYVLENNNYTPIHFCLNSDNPAIRVDSLAVPGLALDLEEVFATPPAE